MLASAWKPDGTKSTANSSREIRSNALRVIATSLVGARVRAGSRAVYACAAAAETERLFQTTKKRRGKFHAASVKAWEGGLGRSSAALGVDRVGTGAR